jgi:hypothetical protein
MCFLTNSHEYKAIHTKIYPSFIFQKLGITLSATLQPYFGIEFPA